MKKLLLILLLSTSVYGQQRWSSPGGDWIVRRDTLFPDVRKYWKYWGHFPVTPDSQEFKWQLAGEGATWQKDSLRLVDGFGFDFSRTSYAVTGTVDTAVVATAYDISLKADKTTTINTTTPLTGGGDLSTNRTLGVGGLTTNGTANYVVGANSGATGWEYKQVLGVASETDVTHAAGSITIGIVDPLAIGKGGTGNSSFTASRIIVSNPSASALTTLSAGNANEMVTVNTIATGYEHKALVADEGLLMTATSPSLALKALTTDGVVVSSDSIRILLAADPGLTIVSGAGAVDSLRVDTTRVGTVYDLSLKADKSTSLTAGDGLGGGGDLSTNRSFAAQATDGVYIATDSIRVLLRSLSGLLVKSGAGAVDSLAVDSSAWVATDYDVSLKADKATTITVAANAPLSSSAGAQDLSGNRTWTVSADTSTVGTGLATQNDISLKADKSTTITIAGTANQITSSAGAQDLSANRTWTLSTPQDIHTAATPQFAKLGLGAAAGTPILYVLGGVAGATIAEIARTSGASASFKFDGNSGDARILTANNNSQSWIFGSDATDNHFKISPSTALETSTALMLTTAGAARVGSATVPANTTAGDLTATRISVGNSSFGTSANGGFSIANSTAPTTSPADAVQVWSQDAAAGDANLYARNEAGLEERLTGLSRVVTSNQSRTTATLSDISGLTFNVESTFQDYNFEAVLFITADAVGGSEYAMGGTATATYGLYHVLLVDNDTNANTITSTRTSWGDSVGQAGTTAGMCIMRGHLRVSGSGTITVKAAQNVANGTTTILRGSYFRLEPTN